MRTTTDPGKEWHEHWIVKLGAWVVPLVFSAGIAFASLNVLAKDVERLDAVNADKRLALVEQKIVTLDELRALVATTNENVVRLCQAQGVACK